MNIYSNSVLVVRTSDLAKIQVLLLDNEIQFGTIEDEYQAGELLRFAREKVEEFDGSEDDWDSSSC